MIGIRAGLFLSSVWRFVGWSWPGGVGEGDVGEGRLQFEWPVLVCRECFSQGVDLGSHVLHRPRMDAVFQDSHVTGKVISSIVVQLWVWRGDGDLVDERFSIREAHTTCTRACPEKGDWLTRWSMMHVRME